MNMHCLPAPVSAPTSAPTIAPVPLVALSSRASSFASVPFRGGQGGARGRGRGYGILWTIAQVAPTTPVPSTTSTINIASVHPTTSAPTTAPIPPPTSAPTTAPALVVGPSSGLRTFFICFHPVQWWDAYCHYNRFSF
ncbi:hypothetical protein RIF29_19211 [Crotalaria pallida]|uniref:Uncharacterized protein n=1 Tax=Crotalaria pallida TaxID=3830 RepID=A0AAN9F2Z6_CROPI